MNLYRKKRRTPVLQIISMIDILIILLIFLVVSTTFKDPRKAKASSSAAAARSVLNVSIPVSEAMNLGTDTASRVSLTITKDEKCYLGDVEVPLPQLVESLKVFKASSPAKLDLRMDEKVPFGTAIKIWDAVKKAGYESSDAPTRVNRGAGTN
jgi:biopolymer transport protein ExbD